jgi:hypothetical protein
MEMAIDKSRRDSASGQSNQMGPRPDQRLEVGETAMRQNQAITDSN